MCYLLMEFGLKGRRVAISSAQILHWSSGRDVGLRGTRAGFSNKPPVVRCCAGMPGEPSPDSTCEMLHVPDSTRES